MKSVGVISVAACSALVVVGLGLAGSATQMTASGTTGPTAGRDYTLNSRGSGALIVKRDGTLASQGSGGLIVKRDGELSEQGSGNSMYLNRSGALAAGGSDVESPGTLTAVATLRQGGQGVDFDPTTDGFAFANYGIGKGQRTDVLGIDSQSARVVLGDQVVCGTQTSPCMPTTEVTKWIDSGNALAIGGQCFGMAASSLLGFQGNRSSGFSGTAGVQNLEAQPELQRSLATWQASQDTLEIEGARRSVTANEATAALVDSFNDPAAERFMITVANKDPKTGSRIQGHALVPFGVFRGADGSQYIATYDPNVPGATTAIAVNPSSNTWTYEPGGAFYDGKGELELIPASALVTQPLHPDPDVDTVDSVDN